MACALATGAVLDAAVVQQTANDPWGNSSFNSAGRWADGQAPSAANDYESNRILRTPAGGIDYSFQGKSLTLRWGGSLVFKGTAPGATITVNDLRLRTGSSITNQETGHGFTLGGGISVAQGEEGDIVLDGNNQGIIVESLISGEGSLKISTRNRTSQADARIVFANSGNSYSGGTVIEQYAWLVSTGAGTLGSGDVRLNGGRLTLESDSGTGFISAAGRLIIGADVQDGLVELNYSGVNTIAGLSLDGGHSFLESGLYDAQKLNQLYGSNLFDGSGQFLVAIPESSALPLLAGAVALLLIGFSRRFRN